MMRYLSICSGIEAATVAWRPIGWKAVGFAEIEPFPCAVLEHHYPNTKNHGDFTKIGAGSLPAVDLVVAGTPCQDFSVAGLRKGMDGERGSLTGKFAEFVGKLRPRWLVWENVPGILSIDAGRAFGAFIGTLAQFGYGFAYRVLDAQYFGIPQRRRRVFLVGHFGDWRAAAAVLFERHSLSGHPAPGRETGTDIAGTIKASLGNRSWSNNAEGAAEGHFVVTPLREIGKRAGVSTDDPRAGIGIGKDGDPMFTLQAGSRHAVAFDCKSGGKTSFSVGGIPGSLRGEGHGGGHAAVAYGFQPRIARNGRGDMGDTASAISAQAGKTGKGDAAPRVATATRVRRLTPRECERLQGFPDDYTLIPYRGKLAADGPRYKALGNSMAVPVMRWIGERIDRVGRMLEENHD